MTVPSRLHTRQWPDIGADGQGGGCVPPDPPAGAVAFLSFLTDCPRYWVSGTDYAITQVLAGTGTLQRTAANGLIVDGINGSWPIAAGAFFTTWAGLAQGAGFTVVFKFKSWAADPGSGAVLFDMPADADVHGCTLSYIISGDVFRAEDYDGRAANNSNIVLNGVNKVAMSYLGSGRVAISANGQAFDQFTPLTSSITAVSTIYIGNSFESAPGRYIEEITLYALKANAALAGLSAL